MGQKRKAWYRALKGEKWERQSEKKEKMWAGILYSSWVVVSVLYRDLRLQKKIANVQINVFPWFNCKFTTRNGYFVNFKDKDEEN